MAKDLNQEYIEKVLRDYKYSNKPLDTTIINLFSAGGVYLKQPLDGENLSLKEIAELLVDYKFNKQSLSIHTFMGKLKEEIEKEEKKTQWSWKD